MASAAIYFVYFFIVVYPGEGGRGGGGNRYGSKGQILRALLLKVEFTGSPTFVSFRMTPAKLMTTGQHRLK